MSSVLEKELTCSICTDILFDPVTYLDCLHTNCGSCSKSWFASRATPTCPECRQTVRLVKPNASTTSLLEDFLARFPDKKRTPEDIEQCRAIYKPGDNIIGPGSAGPLRMFGFGAPPFPPAIPPISPITPAATPPTAPAAMRAPFGPLQTNYRAGRSTSTLTPITPSSTVSASLSRGGTPPWMPFNEFPSLMDIDAALPMINSQHQRMFQQFLGSASMLPPPTPPFGPSSSVSRSPPSSPRRSSEARSITDLLRAGASRAPHISCNECRKHVGNNMHYECTLCTMYHLCTTCYRRGATCPSAGFNPSHVLLPQKLTTSTSEPRPHLQTGVFCSMCEEWADEDRGERTTAPNAFFWHCETCNDGHWVYCQRCILRGICCTHTLTLWTNSRNPSSPSPFPNLVIGPPRETVTSRLPAAIQPGRRWLEARGYGRWQYYTVSCDFGNHTISPWTHWMHCTQCDDGRWDICDSCRRYLTVSPTTGNTLCTNGHELSTLSLAPEGGMALQSIRRPKVKRPEMVAGATERRETVVATQSCWEGERGDGRKWGGGEQLCFPKGARLTDVVCAFVDESDEESWWWGVYAGVGGIFSGRMVRFIP